MPHQCLSCGFAFEDGSTALLKGCPGCKGTRFFYSKDAVDDAKRQQIAADAQKDLRQVVTDMLSEASPEAKKALEDKADGDGWAQLKPKDLRKLVNSVKNEARKAETPAPEEPETAETKARREALAAQRAKIEAEIAEARSTDEKPDTVTVGDGEYAIDIQGLLEKDPIVVQKDGAYMIHLPSLFQGKE